MSIINFLKYQLDYINERIEENKEKIVKLEIQRECIKNKINELLTITQQQGDTMLQQKDHK